MRRLTVLLLLTLIAGVGPHYAASAQPSSPGYVAPASASPPVSNHVIQPLDPNNCGTPDDPRPCPPMPRHPLPYFPKNRSQQQ